MPQLRVDLREGFTGQTVIVRVSGREVYRKDGVQTNYSVGIADRIALEVPSGQIQVEVALPGTGSTRRITHDASGPATLAFALTPEGELISREVDPSPLDL